MKKHFILLHSVLKLPG